MLTRSRNLTQRLAAWLLAVCLLAGCSRVEPGLLAAQPSPAPAPSATPPVASPAPLDPSPTPGWTATSPPPAATSSPPTEAATATPTEAVKRLPDPPAQRTRYRLEAGLDYAAHSLAVREAVTYTNTTPESLTALPLVIEPLNYSHAFSLGGLAWADGSRLTSYQMRDTYLNLILPQPLAPGLAVSFAISYTLQLPDTTRLPNLRPYPFGYTELQANLGDWYPFVPLYQPGHGWLIHPSSIYGEHLAQDVSDFDVTLRTGATDGLVIAAGAPPDQPGPLRHYSLAAARSFAWSASPYYQVLTQTVTLAGGEPVLVSSYSFPFYEKAGQRTLQTAGQALQLYSRQFGNYPLRSLSVVQADFLDGMEYPGLFFLGKDFFNWYNGSEQTFLTTLTAHEVAHQWWYAVVGNDPAQEPWLDEALCTYSEVIFYENYYPAALDWWWQYRVNYYKPYGRIDISIYDVQNAPGFYRPYRDAVYLNGANFIAELRQLIGDEAFFAALDDYLAHFAYRQATAASFFAAVRAHTQVDLAPLQAKYFRR